MTKRVGTNQIVKILDIFKQGLKTADEICREYGISRSTLYKWKNKYDGMSVSELNRLKQLEDENRRLKAMYADLSLVHEAFKDAVAKAITLGKKRELAEHMISDSNISVRRSCQEINISRASYYYVPVQNNDVIEEQLLELANKHKKYGYRKLYQKLRQKGIKVNHKKVLRLYSENKLKLRIKARKKLKVIKQPLEIPTQAQKVWALDFMHDSLSNGSKIRSMNIVDLFSSRAVDIYVDRNINSYKVIDISEQLKLEQGLPEIIRSDNGREFRCKLVQDWAIRNNVKWDFIQPGKPMQNGYCERFNGTFRYEVFDAYIFDSLAEVRSIVTDWLHEYNYERPHSRLQGLTPMQYENKIRGNCLL